MDWYPWVVVAHVVGAFGFVAAHGVSMFVAFAIRREGGTARVAAMLDVSSMSLTGVYVSLLLLLATGIAGGFMGSYWDKAWIWISLATLVALTGGDVPAGLRPLRQGAAGGGPEGVQRPEGRAASRSTPARPAGAAPRLEPTIPAGGAREAAPCC